MELGNGSDRDKQSCESAWAAGDLRGGRSSSLWLPMALRCLTRRDLSPHHRENSGPSARGRGRSVIRGTIPLASAQSSSRRQSHLEWGHEQLLRESLQ